MSEPTSPAGRRFRPSLLALTALNSAVSGIVTSGIAFITRQGYDFSALENYGLAGCIGLTYVVGACTAGRIVARLRAYASTRALLAWQLLAMGSLCALPSVCGPWAVWPLALIYSPLAGILWPIIESYVSGGRGGERLRSAIGTWNTVWAGALVVSYVAITPYCESHPAATLLCLGVVQALSALALLGLPRDPLPHVDEPHPHAPEFAHFLNAFRLLLPTGYLLYTALSPFVPNAMERLAIDRHLHAALFAVALLLPRTLGFVVLTRWHGWHGRWSFPLAGSVLLLGGFALAIGASWAASGAWGVCLHLAGLAAFGCGMSAVYQGAIYYAMEVGQSEVAAGGTHELLIGVGYTVGPLFGVASAAAVRGGWLARSDFELGVLLPALAVALWVTHRAWHVGHRRRRARSQVGRGAGVPAA
ncbi:MAG: hypothetical protein AB7O52_04030 [Planctomycetota bacterium]